MQVAVPIALEVLVEEQGIGTQSTGVAMMEMEVAMETLTGHTRLHQRVYNRVSIPRSLPLAQAHSPDPTEAMALVHPGPQR